MKTKLKFAGVVFIMLAFSPFVNAQSTTQKKQIVPSDIPTGYTYDFAKVQNLIIERLTTPAKSNAIAQPFLDQPDFPSLSSGKTVDANYKDLLRQWIEKNPALIINTLKSRTDIVTQY